jgi:hypothetical protein
LDAVTASARENIFGLNADLDGIRMDVGIYLFGATSWFALVKK